MKLTPGTPVEVNVENFGKLVNNRQALIEALYNEIALIELNIPHQELHQRLWLGGIVKRMRNALTVAEVL